MLARLHRRTLGRATKSQVVIATEVGTLRTLNGVVRRTLALEKQHHS